MRLTLPCPPYSLPLPHPLPPAPPLSTQSTLPTPLPLPRPLQDSSLVLVGAEEGDKEAAEDKEVLSQHAVLSHQGLQVGSKLAGAGLPGHVDVHLVLPQAEGAVLQLLSHRQQGGSQYGKGALG